jgi:hypothetical protein
MKYVKAKEVKEVKEFEKKVPSIEPQLFISQLKANSIKCIAKTVCEKNLRFFLKVFIN